MVTAGNVATIRVKLGAPVKEPPPGRGPPLGTWITWGVGVASLGVFAAFGAMALSASSKLDACAPSCPESVRADAANGERDSIIANVALGIGAAGLVAGAVIWIATPRPAVAPASARAFVSLTPGGGSLGLIGSF
jgi:hypothetical protein